jgi:hypothetical protein
MTSDGDVIKLARRLDALMWKARKILDTLRECDHPNADEITDALEAECEVLARPTHVISSHLEHPNRYECSDFGIQRKDKE